MFHKLTSTRVQKQRNEISSLQVVAATAQQTEALESEKCGAGCKCSFSKSAVSDRNILTLNHLFLKILIPSGVICQPSRVTFKNLRRSFNHSRQWSLWWWSVADLILLEISFMRNLSTKNYWRTPPPPFFFYRVSTIGYLTPQEASPDTEPVLPQTPPPQPIEPPHPISTTGNGNGTVIVLFMGVIVPTPDTTVYNMSWSCQTIFSPLDVLFRLLGEKEILMRSGSYQESDPVIIELNKYIEGAKRNSGGDNVLFIPLLSISLHFSLHNLGSVM